MGASIHLSKVVLQCWGQKHTHTHSAQIHTRTVEWRVVSDKLGQIDPVRVQSVSPETMCEVDSVCVYVCVWYAESLFLYRFSVMPPHESKGLPTKTFKKIKHSNI